jgi:serine protease Do
VQPQRVNGMGTGIVLDPRGLHPHQLPRRRRREQPPRAAARRGRARARIVATDKEADLAVIKIEPARPLPVIGLGTSAT